MDRRRRRNWMRGVGYTVMYVVIAVGILVIVRAVLNLITSSAINGAT